MNQDQPLDRSNLWQRRRGAPANPGGRRAAQGPARRTTDPEIVAARQRRETRDRMGIVVAFDQPLLREAIRALLEAERDLQIIGEYGDGREVVQAVQRARSPGSRGEPHDAPSLRPRGYPAHSRAHAYHPRCHCIDFASELYAAHGLRHGAVGYVATAARGKHLVKAVRAARSGRRYLSPALTARGVDAHLKQTPTIAVDPYNTLTSREREVLLLAADGSTESAGGRGPRDQPADRRDPPRPPDAQATTPDPDGARPLRDRDTYRSIGRTTDPPLASDPDMLSTRRGPTMGY